MTARWPGGRFPRVVAAVLVAGGVAGVMANALGKVLDSDGFFMLLVGRGFGDHEVPSVWAGLALLAAGYALRRAAGRYEEDLAFMGTVGR
ncbi:hypothetical protein [Nonomuraea sp. NPDC050783]|uniref:hypothetical protein n=1 Tax=Nonomuraea sp. NPDC050783 TaxID=3154634 RepID=UPI003467AC39